MKDEFNGVKITEFVGLKAKMYSLISVDDKEVNKAKEINKKLKHKEYLDVLFINYCVFFLDVLKVGIICQNHKISKIFISQIIPSTRTNVDISNINKKVCKLSKKQF